MPSRRRPATRPLRKAAIRKAPARPAAPPPSGGLIVPVELEGYTHGFDRVVVGRRRQHRIDLRLALGSLTEVESRAYVLGLFKDVAPTGPAQAVDERLGGVLKEFTHRRMLAGNVGEVFALPTYQNALRADLLLFAGLGRFDQLTDEVQALAAENVMRTCLKTRVDEFATVLFGAGSGQDTRPSLRHLLGGFFRALKDADGDHHFRRVILCELDEERYADIKQELFRLSSTPLFDDVEVTLDEVKLAASPAPAAAPVRAAAPGGDVRYAYLIVRQVAATPSRIRFSASILTAGAKATVLVKECDVDARALDAHLAGIEAESFTAAALQRFGDRLRAMVLHEDVTRQLAAMRDSHLIVVHDAPSARVPWETLWLRDGRGARGWFPAAEHGMSRRYAADDLSVAKWLEQRREDAKLTMLLVVNPTGDLPGAEDEGKAILDAFGEDPSVAITVRRHGDATKERLLADFRSGRYDVVHYAGHAHFDPRVPGRSGIRCADEVLAGMDLIGLGTMPSLMVFNACEAGRIRREKAREGLRKSIGLAEAFLRAGLATYVGTYWPVGDDAAEVFARRFYRELVRGAVVGKALLTARAAVQETGSVDWADYLHYGPYDFALKRV